MSYLAKKEEKACYQFFLDQARALVFRVPFLRGFFIIFLGRFLYKGKTVEKFLNKQLARSSDFSAAWNHQTINLRVNNQNKLKKLIEKARK